MSDSSEPSLTNVTINEPFHGTVWISSSRSARRPVVNIAISIEQSWDTDIVIGLDDAVVLADALGKPGLHVSTADTSDGAAAVIVASGDRMAVTILDDRISDVLILGSQTEQVTMLLRAAAT